LVYNRWFSAKDKEEKLLTDAKVFGEVDYATIEEPSFSQDFEWEITEAGTAHGLRGWFENELSDTTGLSNAIEVEDSTYASPFFPFEKEVKVKKGDRVVATISAKYEKGDYAWSWRTQIFEKRKKGKIKADFNQSVLASMFIEPAVLLKQSEYFVPNRNETAEIDIFILDQMDGEAMQGDIADALVEKFPKKFKKFENALEYTANISQRYSK